MISTTLTSPVTFKATPVAVATSYITPSGKIQFNSAVTLGAILGDLLFERFCPERARHLWAWLDRKVLRLFPSDDFPLR